MAPHSAPPYIFSTIDSISQFTMRPKDYLLTHDQHETWLLSGALVFDTENRVLLVQRAAHDSMPNRWECPGGAVDDTDKSILHAVARELWEESGLVAKCMEQQVGPEYVFFSGTTRVAKFTFLVEVESTEEVTLDADEHQRFVWATEEECRCGVVGGGDSVNGIKGEGMVVEFTSMGQRDTFLEGFRMRKELKGV